MAFVLGDELDSATLAVGAASSSPWLIDGCAHAPSEIAMR
jgi:hypothetical protein